MPLSKQALRVLNNTNFPNNNSQYISPELLREFNGEMITSMELTQSMSDYAVLEGGNAFIGSQSIDGNVSIDKTKALNTNAIYWNNNTVGYTNLEIVNSSTNGNVNIGAINGKVQIVSSSLNITNGTFSASLQEGYTWVGNGSNRTQLVPTSSFGSGGTINTGSFATTGSNTFVGVQTITGSNGTLKYSGTNLADTSLASIHAKDENPWLERFYNDTFSPTNSVMSYFGWNDGRFVFHNDSTQSIGIQTNGYSGENGLLVYPDKVAFVNNVDITGSIKTNGNITWAGNSFNSSLTGSLYFSSLNDGTLYLNADGGEGDVVVGYNGWGGELKVTGSLGVTGAIKGTGSIILQPDQTNARVIEIYNTSATDTHITASGGNLFLGNDETYVLATTYGNQKQITIRGDQGIAASGSLSISGSLTSSLQQGYVWVGDGNNRTQLVPTSSFAGGSTNTGSLMVTGSVAGNVLTFTKGDSSQFSLTVATGSGGGGSTDTGSLLVTASFNGNLKEITFTKGNTNQFVLGGFATTGSNIFRGTQQIETSSALIVGSNEEYIKTEFNTLTLQNKTAVYVNYLAPSTFFQSNGNFAFQNTVASAGSGSMSFLIQNGGGYTTTAEGGGNIQFTTSGSSGGNIGFTTNTGSISSNITNGGSYSATVNGGGSISFTAGTGSINLTTPGEINLQGAVRIRQKDSGNPVTIVNSSGSLLFSATSYTSASLHLSQSSGTQNTSVNFVFKTNNNTPDTIISGSNNIFLNPAAPTAGFKRYFGGSGNIVLQTAAPQISSSMGFSPTMTNNIWGGSGASPTMRGPVSSSAWTISNNIVNNQGAWNIGTAAATDAKQMIAGFSAIANVGSIFPAIQAYKTPLSASAVFTGNTGTGQISMNCDSSSIVVSGNGNFGTTTINNSYFPATINNQTGNIVLSSNTLFGTSIINASGSDTTFTGVSARGAFNNVIGGYSTIGLVLNGDNSNLNSTAVIGGGLVVTGSNSKVAAATANADFGSAFFGRWNDTNGNRAISGPTVFAVGTGTSTSARKTAFLIDSGSNTFVEGTLNVSGSTFMTGSVSIVSNATASQLKLPSGSNQQIGTAVLDGANPGTVIVSNSLVTANSIIMVTKQTLTNAHSVAISSKGAGTFTITSTGNGDSDTVGYVIWNNS